MKKLILLFSFSLFISGLSAQVLPNFGGERAGLSTLSFLKNDMNPRSLAMGGASVALSGDAYSAITNPATLTDLENTSIALSHIFLNGGVNQSYLNAAFPLKSDVDVLAFSVNALNSGAMEERTEFQPMGTGRQVYVSNIAVGATYSRKLSNLFSAGVTLKYIYEGVANYVNHNATVDLAFLYNTDFKDLKFAVMVQNFGGNSTLNANDDDIPVVFNRKTGVNLDANTVPTVFSMGISMVPFKQESQSLLASVQLNHPNDNAENIRIGLEYELKQLLFARAGYRISVKGQSLPTFGVGFKTRLGANPLHLDYTINPTDYMGFQQSIGLRININNDSRN